MKKLLLIAAAFLGISTVSAFAACTSPAVMHDFPGTSFNMSLGTTPDGNCGSNVLVTTWGGVTLGAPSNYGTSPGAVAVPGVNAFITNTVPVTGTFWQTTQPVSGTFWQTTQPISVASLPLPSGAATSALQTTGNTSLGTIATNSATQATAANQTTGNTSLATIATNTTGAATAANQATGNASLATIATNSAAPLPAQSTHTVNIGAVDSISQYPAGATPISASATGTTAATTATLAGTTGKTTYICSYSIRANATATTTVQNTITGLLGGTDTHEMWVPANTAGLGVDEQIFMPCHPASTTNTGISAVSGAPGTGGVVSVTVKGFQL